MPIRQLGYTLFEEHGDARLLLHPSDTTTGVRFSSLAMIHAILEDMLTPEQVTEHLRLIDAHLKGPDGVRLFDKPLPYHGGPQRLFQRAETATFFGREIGLMYYSSSDAAFEDRYQAGAEYERVARGAIALGGGWRVYSSGAGIALGLIVRHFLGLSSEAAAVSLDPVIPPELNGLRVQSTLLGRPVEVQYRVRGRGCGVTSIVVNGEAMPYTTRANPYQRGAALVDNGALLRRLSAKGNVLAIDLG